MKRTILAVTTAALLVAAVATTTGCTRVRLSDRPETRTYTETKAVPIQGASRLTTELRIGIGELTVSSTDASSGAMQADFTYAPASWKPEVAYDVSGGTGRLAVRQPDHVNAPVFSDVMNSWDIKLPKGVPTDLTLQLGVGSSTVDLRGLDLTTLNVLTGVGSTSINLSDPRTSDLSARVEAGVGRLTIRLPKTVGVRVSGREEGVGKFSADGFTAQGGAWVNSAYSGTGPKIEIDLVRGIGDVTLVLVD